jgi:hypothetical protein
MLRASTGKLRLRLDGTTIADSVALVAGETYRIGFRQRAGTGADGVLEAYLATGTAAFTTPFATTSAGTWTDGATRARIGASTSIGIQATLDDVRLGTASMPAP